MSSLDISEADLLTHFSVLWCDVRKFNQIVQIKESPEHIPSVLGVGTTQFSRQNCNSFFFAFSKEHLIDVEVLALTPFCYELLIDVDSDIRRFLYYACVCCFRKKLRSMIKFIKSQYNYDFHVIIWD